MILKEAIWWWCLEIHLWFFVFKHWNTNLRIHGNSITWNKYSLKWNHETIMYYKANRVCNVYTSTKKILNNMCVYRFHEERWPVHIIINVSWMTMIAHTLFSPFMPNLRRHWWLGRCNPLGSCITERKDTHLWKVGIHSINYLRES